LTDRINQRYAARHLIQSALLEVTHRCPCRCEHCYLPEERGEELCIEEVAGVLRQLRDEGTLELGLTGGEPFLRRDFPEILSLARKDRFLVTVLTTGVCIGEAEVRLLKRTGVRSVEVSILGAEPDTHDAIMHMPGAHRRMVEAARRLAAADIPVKLKATVLRQNYREVAAMAAIARELGARFLVNIVVLPGLDGSERPQRAALTEEEVARLDAEWVRSGLIPGEEEGRGAILCCNAGKTVAGISPYGDVYPCIVFRRSVGNLREMTLRELWHETPAPFLRAWRALRREEVAACHACELAPFCQRCPGVAYLETGDIRAPSPTACAMARGLLRARRT
jgi:radical SAM protein with 4Fe4S-binding SPASM domain